MLFFQRVMTESITPLCSSKINLSLARKYHQMAMKVFLFTIKCNKSHSKHDFEWSVIQY